MAQSPAAWFANVASPDETRRDIALMNRIVMRDEQAVADLYDRHHRLLFGVIVKILGDRCDAEDVLQEVFLVVWTRVETYNVALGSPIGWLVRIARNRGIDCLRASHMRGRVAGFAPLPPTQESPEVSAVVRQEQRAIAMALQSLPPDQQVLIEHAYFTGLSQSELATRFQLPLGTVKDRIRRGMTALRRALVLPTAVQSPPPDQRRSTIDSQTAAE